MKRDFGEKNVRFIGNNFNFAAGFLQSSCQSQEVKF